MKPQPRLNASERSDGGWLLAVISLATLASAPGAAYAGEDSSPVLKIEHFDRDPGWEGYNNRIVPKHVLMVKQDFGYSATHFAGAVRGEMGGVIQRCTIPACYAARIGARTLDDTRTASGSFAITASQPG